ncbi:hypothetical protein T1J70_08120 [Lactiplantibacillus plantarum]|nr:hypothetical protein TUW04_02055 [Lactiplantibacillus plantarum]WQG53891.1 hypothetical protein T1J70_08120 [Lactiplantibacillus plantarum]
MLRGHNLGGVFSGHVHFVSSYLIGDNILNVVAGSAAYAIDCHDPHHHYVHEGSSYQIITIDRGQVGVTTRQLLHGKAVIDELTIPDTKFVGRAPQGYESR